jgi:hypothetical protein
MVEARPPKLFSCGCGTALGCGAGRGAGGSLPVEHPQHIFFHIAMPLRSLLFIRHVASGKGQVPAPFLPRHRGASGFGRMLLPIVPGNGHDGQIPRRRLRSGLLFCLKSVLYSSKKSARTTLLQTFGLQ